MIVSIDGPAGSGKSTVADALSKKLNFIHFNSGSLYRGIAVYLKSLNFDFDSITDNSSLPALTLKCEIKNGTQQVFVNGLDTTTHLRDNDISQLSAVVAQNKFVRIACDDCQREFCNNNNVVIEGRDIGSHVFPNAEHKFYLDCSVMERAKRRLLDEIKKSNNITLNEMIEQIKERDAQDKARTIAPLVVPKGATIVDSTNLSIDEVVDTMYKKVKQF